MPFLRVIRDKRGYETTYLMDWYREGNRQRSRILYVFRTPGGVRVGRAALEPDVRRHIQSRYPDLSFDWKAVFDTRQMIDAAAEARRPLARRRSEDESPAVVADQERSERSQPSETSHRGAPRPPIPLAVDGATLDEQVAFLAHWYPVVRERVEQRITDPTRREAFMALVEQLNPAAWTTAEEVTAGLLQAPEALERLSRVLTRRRRRSGRGRPADPDTLVGGSGEPAEAELPASSLPDEVPSSGE